MKVSGLRIKELREQKGYSMDELGKKVGVAKATVYRWEHGEINVDAISSSNLRKLADVLGTSIAYIRGVTDDPAPEPDIEAIGEAYLKRIDEALVQRVLQTQAERMGQYALDNLAAQNGYSIDYTVEGDVFLKHGPIIIEITDNDVKSLSDRLTEYAAFLLKQLEDKKA